MATVESERRSIPRYRLQLPVILKWWDGEGLHVKAGFTRDVSVNGLRVMCADAPAVATPLEVQLLLPALNDSANTPIEIQSSGRVVRRLGVAEGFGIAITAQLDLGQLEDEEL